MEARKKNSEKSGSSPELAAIASQAIEQALVRHPMSRAQLEKLVNEPQPIFEFFEELLAEEENNPVPTFRLYPEQQFFIIEALSGECLKVDHTKLVALYKPRNFSLEAAACFSGDSLPSAEVKVCAYRFVGSAIALEAFAAIAEDVKSLTLTRAQIRHFSAKYADVILLKKMIPIFLFDRCELIKNCQSGLMLATTRFDNYSMSISIDAPEREIVKEKDKNFYLVVPVKSNTEHDDYMLEAMDIYTGI